MFAEINNSNLNRNTENDVSYVSNGEEIEGNKASLIFTEDCRTQQQQIEESHLILQKELNDTKNENKDWRQVYTDIARKLENSKANVTILLKTAREEIRKKDIIISNLKSEDALKRLENTGSHEMLEKEIIQLKKDNQSWKVVHMDISRKYENMAILLKTATTQKNHLKIENELLLLKTRNLLRKNKKAEEHITNKQKNSSKKLELEHYSKKNRPVSPYKHHSFSSYERTCDKQNLRQDMERENRSKRKRSSRSPSPKSYSKHTSTLVKEVKRKYRRAPSLSPIRDRKRNSRRSDSRYSNVNKYASDRSRGDKSAFTETSVQRSSNSKDKPSNVPKKNRDVGGSIAVIPTHTKPIIEKNVPRDESPMEPAKLYSLANETKPSVTDHEIDEEEITSSKEAEEGEITDDEKEEKDANASNINRKTSVTDFGGRSSNNSSSDKENNETLDENPKRKMEDLDSMLSLSSDEEVDGNVVKRINQEIEALKPKANGVNLTVERDSLNCKPTRNDTTVNKSKFHNAHVDSSLNENNRFCAQNLNYKIPKFDSTKDGVSQTQNDSAKVVHRTDKFGRVLYRKKKDVKT